MRSFAREHKVFVDPATADGMLPPTSCWSSHPYSLTAIAVPVRTPLRKPMLFTGMLYHATSPFRAYEFSETTSCSTCFSSGSSATSLSRRAFSFSRSFNRRVWLQPAVLFSPAVVRSARRYRLLCKLGRCFSGWLIRTSICRSMATIGSALCFFRGILQLLLY